MINEENFLQNNDINLATTKGREKAEALQELMYTRTELKGKIAKFLLIFNYFESVLMYGIYVCNYLL